LKSKDKRYSISEIGKYGILIPSEMTSNDRLCTTCYSRGQQIESVNHVVRNTPILLELSRLMNMDFLDWKHICHPVLDIIRVIIFHNNQNNELKKIIQISKIERWVEFLQVL